jgi:hypothetical protein
MSSPESATEPKNLEQLCEMQEALLQRCLPVVESLVDGFVVPIGTRVHRELLDDLRAHVDPDALPPADVRLLAMANRALSEQVEQMQMEINRLLELVKP